MIKTMRYVFQLRIKVGHSIVVAAPMRTSTSEAYTTITHMHALKPKGLKQVHLVQEGNARIPEEPFLRVVRFILTFVSTSWRHPWDPILRITPRRMSAMANATPLVTTVTKPATNPRDADATPRVNIHEFCEEYYEDILAIIMNKVHRDRRKDVHTRLDFREGPRERTREDSHHSSARARTTKPERLKRKLLAKHDQIPPPGTDSRDHPRGRSRLHSLDTSKEDRPKDRERFRSVGESYDDSFSHSYRDGNHSRHMKKIRDNESPLSSVSRNDSSDGRYRRSRSKRHKSTDEDDLTKPWMCEEEDPFTPRIHNFESLRRTRMPNNVKTYDETGDPEDHFKFFQAATQVERWAMPTLCHMFNSTLIGAARLWFDKLPPESIDSYKDLKAAFLAHLKNYNHAKHKSVAKLKHRIPKLKWSTTNNHVDCGVFTMLHLEHYFGKPVRQCDFGLCRESDEQVSMLRRMRFKIATKIVLHTFNVHAKKMFELAFKFESVNEEQRRISIIINAIKNRDERDPAKTNTFGENQEDDAFKNK
nr:reverse transcriptase domain-containing protein [Tanacetum cinerariifolium]